MDSEAVCKSIESIIAKHGFTHEYYPGMKIPGVKRRQNDYFRVQVNGKPVNENDLYSRKVYANGTICWSAPTDNTSELRLAAAQIKAGADLVDAINAAGYTYRLD